MLAEYSVKRPYTVIVAVVIVLVLGVVAFTGMQVDLLPNINLPYSVVVTTYAGASPEEIETVITKPVEEAMATVSNIKNVMSVSSENMSLVILEFNQSTDMTAAGTEMREKLDLVKPYWDDDNIGTPMILQINPDMLPVTIASLDMEGMSQAELSVFTDDNIIPSLESIEGVASVTAVGLAENRVNVVIDDDLIDDINKAIAASIDGDIAKAKRLLSSARSQVAAGYSALDAARADGEAQLNDAQSQLDAGKAALEQGKIQAEDAVAGLKKQQSETASAISALESKKAELEEKISALEAAGQEVPAELKAGLDEVKSQLEEAKAGKQQIDAGLSQAQTQLDEINANLSALNGQQAEIDNGRAALNEQLSDAKSQLDTGMSQINSQSAMLSSAAASAKDKADIKQYITKEMISGILMAQNFEMPAGSVDAAEGTYSVKVGRELESLEDIGNLFLFKMDIDGIDDIRIKDVARVEKASVDDSSYTKVNGNNGILLTFEKQSNYSTSEVSDNILAAFEKLESENEGLTFTAFMDQGEYVHLIINSIIKNLLLGAVLAILILWLCLRDIRPTVLIAVSIPVSLLFAIVLMYFTGVTMNVISMCGLALAVGMLVDNSVVVIENIYRLRKEGLDAIEAAKQGAKQIAGAIIASTLTTCCVFLPIAFTDGLSKQLFSDMGLTIAFALVASLLVALTVVPSMASRVFKAENEKDSRIFAFLKEKYEIAIHWALNRRKLTVLIVIVLLIAGNALALSRGFSFMPAYESTELTATLTTEDTDMSEEDFYAAADKVTEAALKLDGVSGIGAMGGSAASISSMMGGSDELNVTMYISLESGKAADSEEVEEVLNSTAEQYGCEAQVTTSTDMMSYLGGAGVSLTVKGNDLEELASFTEQLAGDIAAVDGIDEVTSDMENPSTCLMITVNKDKVMKKGLTVAQVYQAVAQEIASDTAATTLTMEGSEYSVYVVDESDKMSIDDIADIEVNDKVNVGDVSKITEENSPSSIYRLNQQRYMTVSAAVAKGEITSSVTSDVKKMVSKYETPAGISIEVGGESVQVGDYMKDLIKCIAVALLLMYLIMVAQFQSLKSPFIVMFTVPLAFTGGFLLLFICGFDVSVIALLGFLVLCGVVVNNGIVLVDCINRLIAEGMEITGALVLAGKIRMRPILMTAITTILAMLTMALGIGEGTEMIQPMAIVCIGGLIYATFMTLFFVPVVYLMMHRKDKRKTPVLPEDAAGTEES